MLSSILKRFDRNSIILASIYKRQIDINIASNQTSTDEINLSISNVNERAVSENNANLLNESEI
jgi:hypothetical protein